MTTPTAWVQDIIACKCTMTNIFKRRPLNHLVTNMLQVCNAPGCNAGLTGPCPLLSVIFSERHRTFKVGITCRIVPATSTRWRLCRDYKCDLTTIRLRSDYDVSRVPASIQRDSTRAKNEHVNFSSYSSYRGRIIVESQLWYRLWRQDKSPQSATPDYLTWSSALENSS